jgi:hypothetical protein
MWYLIADANGLSASSQLSAGQRLIIPNKVTNVHNNTGTFRVYDPGEAIGDTLPTLPNEPAPPPARKKHGCGGFGAILLAVVAIVVTAIVAPELIGHAATFLPGTGAAAAVATPATGLTALFGGAAAASVGAAAVVTGGVLAGAAGSIASQGLGLATGLQDKFSWGAVGLAAIAGGVGGAAAPRGLFGGNGLFGGLGSKVVGTALRGAASNIVAQGLGVATGLQDRFDWGGVAATGVGAGISSRINLPGTGGRIVSGVAGGLAASAAESLVTGRDFGGTVTANLPGIIGNTVGNLVADGIAGHGRNGAIGAGDARADQPIPGKGGGKAGGGDGTQARRAAGVAGEDGNGANAQFGEIVVNASRNFRDMYWSMNNYQWSAYFGRAGQRNDESTALWALGLTAPATSMATSSIGPASSYDSPLIQSLKTAQPFSLYYCGPAQQYMFGDGSVFTGTPAGLNRYQQRRAAQANMAYMDRLTGSTIGGIALGVSHEMGASPATQDLLYGLGSSADGMLLSGAALRGGSIGPFTGQNSLNVVNGENGVHANSRLSGRTTWFYELSQRNLDGTQTFLKYGISVNPNTRYSRAFMKDKVIDPIASGTRADMLALERQMVTANPGPLNKEPWAVKARGGN